MERNARGNGSSREKATEPAGLDAESGQGSGQSTEPVGWREETAAQTAGDDASAKSGGGTMVAAPEPDTGDTPAEDEGPKIEVIERDSSLRALLGSILPEIALLIAAGYAFYLAGNFQNAAEPGQLGPGFWPRVAAVGMAIALLARIFQAIRARHRPIVKVTNPVFDADADEAPFDYTRVAIAMGLAVGYVFATMFLGYLIATAVFLAVFIWIGGERRWFVPLIACAMALVSTVVFVGVVYVALPTGVGVFDTVTVAIYELLGLQ